jgi:hypothetical protein
MDATEIGGTPGSGPHPDPVERLRLALWGPVDAGTRRADLHLAACASCRDEVALLREVREHLRAGEGAPESAAALPAEEPDPDFAWAVAVPVAPLAGVRGGDAPEHFRCECGGVSFDLLLHPAPATSRPALSGQVLAADPATAGSGAATGLADLRPVSDADVSVYLDREPVGSVRTDGFGEFVIPVERGRRIGLRVRAGTLVRHVELPADAVRAEADRDGNLADPSRSRSPETRR